MTESPALHSLEKPWPNCIKLGIGIAVGIGLELGLG